MDVVTFLAFMSPKPKHAAKYSIDRPYAYAWHGTPLPSVAWAPRGTEASRCAIANCLHELKLSSISHSGAGQGIHCINLSASALKFGQVIVKLHQNPIGQTAEERPDSVSSCLIPSHHFDHYRRIFAESFLIKFSD
jgi:hypothetical protein